MLEGGSVGRMLEQQRKVREMLEGGSVGRMLEQQRKVREMLEGGSVGRMLEQQRKVREMLEGGNVGQIFETQQRLQQIMRSIAGPSGLAAALAGDAMPSLQLATIVSDISFATDDTAQMDLSEELQAAENELGPPVEHVWWLARLPWTRQIGLLVALLEAIAKATEFEGEITGTALPPAYYTAIDVLVALAAVLLIWIEATGGSPAHSDLDNADD
ncbi:hypothetical protein C8N24_4073 [Solirubrobacter pauli]|uniref:Uncharacterized protein n=2 Tax=Solirubrobacter pauli TaxID=166793 RepID=A0A660KYP2_9ACTN|nr:hypothetical protein C8N24_4073 [Solirubrobacter pauli]